MRIPNRNHTLGIVIKGLVVGAVSLGLMGSGCSERDVQDGLAVTNEVALPSTIPATAPLLNVNVNLDLACADVGIFDETCVLNDPQNPFVNVTILEFDVNNPGGETKFDLLQQLPAGPAGAKTRFYFWATALARRNSGENQYYTALALHELFHINGDPIIQQQALKAYRSLLDNFFESVVFFTCCGRPDDAFSAKLNYIAADNIFRRAATSTANGPASSNWYPNGFASLAGDALSTLALFSEWGYTYNDTTRIITVNGG